jgi:hypothetical protein
MVGWMTACIAPQCLQLRADPPLPPTSPSPSPSTAMPTYNQLPLNRTLPDFRYDECKELAYPPSNTMPKVSVIIIFYNEAMSTLMRNIVRHPPARG